MFFCIKGKKQKGRSFHAMISYAEKDLPIVLKYVVPNLEVLPNFRLFVRHRDDPQAGKTINAIRNSIKNSRKAVCLMTKNYLKSKRQCYELAMIRKHMESRIDQQENLINNQVCRIIRFPDVDIPDEISNLDNSNIKCPVEDGNDNDFWRTLGDALR